MVTSNVRLIRPIGEGAMGSVWLAHHQGLDIPMAVKFIAPQLALHEPCAIERFTSEARAVAQIRHPNVVTVFDFGTAAEVGGLPYLTMEYLEGQDLEQYLADQRQKGVPVETTEVLRIVTAVLSALQKAREHSIVHRDIKPQNIFLQGDERQVKVLDFGIAKDVKDVHRHSTEDGTMVGTPCFMSPEQIASPHEVDYRCDLWAVAVVTYRALTGELPFAGESVGAICLAVLNGDFERPSRRRRDLPVAVDAWFRKALAKDPQDRFQSAREMSADLRRVFATAPPRVHRPRLSQALEQLERKSRRTRAMFIVPLGASLVFSIAFFGRNSITQLMADPATPPIIVREPMHPMPAPVTIEPRLVTEEPVHPTKVAEAVAPAPPRQAQKPRRYSKSPPDSTPLPMPPMETALTEEDASGIP
jgi:serine/threonine protein kinase